MSVLKKEVVMKNKNLLVTVMQESTTFDNGLNVKTVRGKRDVVVGIIQRSPAELKLPDHSMCWFPIYAAQELLYNGTNYLVVPYEDVIMVEMIIE
jgi:hypothetical protein